MSHLIAIILFSYLKNFKEKCVIFDLSWSTYGYVRSIKNFNYFTVAVRKTNRNFLNIHRNFPIGFSSTEIISS